MKSPRENKHPKDEKTSSKGYIDYIDKTFNATKEGKRKLAAWYEREIGDINRRHIVKTTSEKDNYYKWQRLRQAFSSRASNKGQLVVRMAFLRCFLQKNDVLLDVGCGDGWYMNQLISKGYKNENVFGIDIGQDVIAAAAQKELRVKVSDMHDLDFSDNFFELVFCSHTLEHSHSPQLVLKQFRRVLNNKGRVVIVLPVEKQPSIFHAHAFQSEQALEQMLKNEGFTSIYTRTMQGQIWACGALGWPSAKESSLRSKIMARALNFRVTAVLYWNFRLNDARQFIASILGKLVGHR